MNANFEINKIRRLINAKGEEFCFKRQNKNEFGETDTSSEPFLIYLRGIYHEETSYIRISEQDASRIQSKPKPMILTLWQSVACENEELVKIDDIVIVSNKSYKVTGIKNISQGNFGADISLELINKYET